MKLSEAILLGDSLKKSDSEQWLSADGSCGCALGGALLAAGVDASKFFGEHSNGEYESICETESVKRLWPWLTPDHLKRITLLYIDIDLGKSTIEQIADWVHSIEPEHDGTTLTKLELAVRYAEMNAGIERSTDSEISDEMGAAVSQGFRP